MTSFNNTNVYTNINYSVNKENNLNLYNVQINKISSNKSKNLFPKKEKQNKKEICTNKALLIKKCQMNFSSLYGEPLPKYNYNVKF